MRYNIQLEKFFISNVYTKPQQPMIQVMLLIAIFYVTLQYLVVNFLIFFLGTAAEYLFYTVLLSNGLTYVLTVYFAISVVYSQRDFHTLSSLPISPKQIVIAKIVSGFALPVTVVTILHIPIFLLMVLKYKLTDAVMLLILLLITNLLVALSLLFVLSILSRFRSLFKNALLYLCTRTIIVLFIGICPIISLLYYKFEEIKIIIENVDASAFSSITATIVDVLNIGYNFALQESWIKMFTVPLFLENSFIYLLILVSISFIFFAASVKNLASSYHRNGLLVNSVEHKSNVCVYNTRNKWSTYLQREYWIIQSELYFKMQVLLGLVLAPIVTFIYLVVSQMSWGNIEFIKNEDVPIVAYMILLTSCLNNISGTPYSREGKHYASSVTLPFNRTNVFLAKVTVSSLISVVSVFISYVIYMFSGEMNVLDVFHLIITVLLVTNYNALAPIYDRRHPLLEWENPSEAVKTNPNVLMSLLYGGPLVGIMIISHFSLLSLDVSQWLATSIIGILTIGSTLILFFKIIRVPFQFEQMRGNVK